MRRLISRAIFSAQYPAALLALFLVWFVLWAIRPPHFADFLLEHVFTALFLVFLVATRTRFRLSNLSYTLVFVFLCLHVVGAHYTYSEVPYEEWLRRLASWFGVKDWSVREAFALTRNHYDRLVHFSFGLLMAYPVREVFIRVARVRGFWGYFLPLDVMMSMSLLYEVIEWGVAAVIAGEVGQSYLGTQGDEWDAQKDMALATLGGFLAMLATALVNFRLKRDFAAEFARSLRPSDPPLGEIKIQELLKEKRTSSHPKA